MVSYFSYETNIFAKKYIVQIKWPDVQERMREQWFRTVNNVSQHSAGHRNLRAKLLELSLAYDPHCHGPCPALDTVAQVLLQCAFNAAERAELAEVLTGKGHMTCSGLLRE